MKYVPIIREEGICKSMGMGVRRYLIIVLLAAATAVMAEAGARAAGCPGDPTGTGVWYTTGVPSLNITYNSVSNKIFSTGDLGMGQVLQLDFGATSTIMTNSLPYDIVTDQATGYMYVSLRQSAAIKVLDKDGNAVTTIATGNSPAGMAISTLNKRLYVANTSSNNVTVIDVNPASPSYNRVLTTIAVSSNPIDVSVDDSAGYGYVFVSNMQSRSISIISESLYKVVGVVALTFRPGEIAMNKTTHKLYVVNMDGNYVAVINANSLPASQQTTFTFGSDPWGVAVDPNTNTIYITDYTDKTVTRVSHDVPPDGVAYSLIQTDAFTSSLRGIYVYPTTGKYYAAGSDGYSSNGLPGCNRKFLDNCLELRAAGSVTDADVETFLQCYFQQN